MVYKLTEVYTMTLAITMLKNMFLLHTQTQDYHLMLQCATLKCHDVDIFSLKDVTYVGEWNNIGN